MYLKRIFVGLCWAKKRNEVSALLESKFSRRNCPKRLELVLFDKEQCLTSFVPLGAEPDSLEHLKTVIKNYLNTFKSPSHFLLEY